MERSAIRSSRAWLVIAIVGVAGLTAGTSPAAELAGGARLEQLPQSWRDDRGQVLALADLVGHRVILTMAYVNCHRICPATLAELERLQKLLDARGEYADFVVVGYDPVTDDPAAWHRYRINRRLSRTNWHFLSGSRDDTERLARQLGFEFWKADEHVIHGSRALVFDAHGMLTTELGPETRDWPATL